MADLVRQHPGELLLVHRLHQTGGHRDRGVLGVAAGGEGVRLRILHDIDARHRHACGGGELPHERVELRRRALVDLARAVHGEHHLVGVPIGEEVHRSGNKEGGDHARLAADQEPDPHE